MSALLDLHGVTRHYDGLTALFQVDMVVPEGQIVGLIGPNGAGKTTLLNCISGLDHPSEGTIAFDGRPIQRMPPHRIAGLGVARTYQNIRLFGEMTALDNLIVAQHRQGWATVFDSLLLLPGHRRETKDFQAAGQTLLERFELREVADHVASSLPYGDQRRLEMARALATHPRLLLLDEPTAGMNAVETRAFGAQVLRAREEGLTVLIVEHDMALIGQVCDSVYVLNFGRIIAQGTPEEVKQNPDVVEAYLGEDEDDGFSGA
jgi:branched-chain amino acid transport system ATP-binding protein